MGGDPSKNHGETGLNTGLVCAHKDTSPTQPVSTISRVNNRYLSAKLIYTTYNCLKLPEINTKWSLLLWPETILKPYPDKTCLFAILRLEIVSYITEL